jgi:hypothetical protein
VRPLPERFLCERLTEGRSANFVGTMNSIPWLFCHLRFTFLQKPRKAIIQTLYGPLFIASYLSYSSFSGSRSMQKNELHPWLFLLAFHLQMWLYFPCVLLETNASTQYPNPTKVASHPLIFNTNDERR